MAYRLLTCPESAHIEMIEHEAHPLGLLVVACSHFHPPDRVTCARTCAARMDRRRHLENDPTVTGDDHDTTGVDGLTELERKLRADLLVGDDTCLDLSPAPVCGGRRAVSCG